MFKRLLRIGILFCPLVPLASQDIDTNITLTNRSPSTVASQIYDASERAAFLALFPQKQPEQMLEIAKSFLARFPQSAFLFQAYEVAARASFDLQDYDSGLNYAEKSLALLPENPLLLVHMPFARMVSRDGRHYFDIQQSDGKWHTYPVDYTIGSKFQQAYATKLPNGEIHVFPIQYSKVTKKWINYWKIIDAPGSERADLRAWEKLDGATSYQAVCAVCHTSRLRNVKDGGFDVQNVEFKEPGIDCEMCHGPSVQHVAEMTANEPFPKQPVDPPVNFHDVGNRDFVRICAQCHMQSAIRTSGATGELNYSRSGEFFVRNPSIPFGEFSRIGFYKDGRFRQTTFIVEALERSQCFKKGQVSCGTCHDPHGLGASSDPTSLKFRDQPDLMCTGCHSQFKNSATFVTHTHHRAESEGSRCVSCHMPRIMDAVLFRARTHQIDDIPDAEMAERFGQRDSPNACLLCHSDKSSQWLKQELAAWKPTPRG
jgi:predicted CXXCH cytochrome family protein